MKKIVLTTVAVAALMISGCSKKTPEVSMGQTMTDAEKMQQIAAQVQNQIQNVYFDFDRYNIKADMKSVISSNAALLNQNGAEFLNVKVEGNCDEWGTDEYNYALGLKRAKASKDALVAEGVNPDRISVVSYGESNPVCTDKGKACDAQNRRDEFKVNF